MTNILITGSTGFIGRALTDHLDQHGFSITAAVRRPTDTLPASIQQIPVGGLLPETNWTSALFNINIIIHLAARVHVMDDRASNPFAEFRRTNTAGTLNLARQAAAAGVRRFIFLSSIKVNGEFTLPGKSFTASDVGIPDDPYGISKYEAEQGLRKIAAQTGLEIVIIRPPLVYGPGVKANFQSMMSWLHKGIPLPLGAIHNQRSFVALDNLLDLITACIDHPAAANQTFLVSDGEDLSTTDLLRRLGAALGKPARLLPVPASWLQKAADLIGKGDLALRLLGSLQVDMRKTCEMLNWSPQISVDEGLRRAAQRWR